MKAKLKKIGWPVARLMAQRLGIVSDLMFEASSLYVRAYKNLNYHFESNGELELLDRLKEFPIQTVLDVGANHGVYTAACLARFPNAEIHCFEIVPATFAKLRQNLSGQSRAILNEIGLSDQAAQTVIRVNVLEDGRSSLIAGITFSDRDQWIDVHVDTIRGSDYIDKHGIANIDLLKIDVEGAEHLVFKGFGDTLSAERIKVIQFEYGMPNIYSRFLLKDFWELLEAAGYRIGPLMPDGVDFRPYDPRDEDFQGACNYVAVDARRSELCARLQATRARRLRLSR